MKNIRDDSISAEVRNSIGSRWLNRFWPLLFQTWMIFVLAMFVWIRVLGSQLAKHILRLQ